MFIKVTGKIISVHNLSREHNVTPQPCFFLYTNKQIVSTERVFTVKQAGKYFLAAWPVVRFCPTICKQEQKHELVRSTKRLKLNTFENLSFCYTKPAISLPSGPSGISNREPSLATA